MGKWICIVCDHAYNPELDDKDTGMPTGTKFEDVPEDWVCPLCGTRKSDFVLLSDRTEENTKIDKKGTDKKREGDDAQQLLAHSSSAMTDRYIRTRNTDRVLPNSLIAGTRKRSY